MLVQWVLLLGMRACVSAISILPQLVSSWDRNKIVAMPLLKGVMLVFVCCLFHNRKFKKRLTYYPATDRLKM